MSKREKEDKLIEGYIQTKIFDGNRKMYPDDIRGEILSFYHNLSYFMKAGNFCTINQTQNILTCKFSYPAQIVKSCICFILDAISQGISLLTAIKISILLLLYVFSTAADDQLWMFAAKFITPWNYDYHKIPEYLSLPMYISRMAEMIIVYWILIPSIILVWNRLPLIYRQIFRQTCKGWGWFSDINGCYGSVVMPSNIEDNEFVEYEYKVRVTKCSDKLLVGIGFVDNDDVSDNRLNGVINGNERSLERFIWLNTDYGGVKWNVGDIMTIVFIPNQRCIKCSVNGVDLVPIPLEKGPFINYRLYIEIMNYKEDCILGATKSLTMELLS